MYLWNRGMLARAGSIIWKKFIISHQIDRWDSFEWRVSHVITQETFLFPIITHDKRINPQHPPPSVTSSLSFGNFLPLQGLSLTISTLRKSTPPNLAPPNESNHTVSWCTSIAFSAGAQWLLRCILLTPFTSPLPLRADQHCRHRHCHPCCR